MSQRSPVFQNVEQSVKCLVGQGQFRCRCQTCKGQGLIAEARIRTDLRSKPYRRLKLFCFLLVLESDIDKVEWARHGEAADMNRGTKEERGADITYFSGRNSQQDLGMRQRYLCRFLRRTIGPVRNQDETSRASIQADTGASAIPFGEIAFDDPLPSPLHLDQAGQGRSEEKTSAGAHGSCPPKNSDPQPRGPDPERLPRYLRDRSTLMPVTVRMVNRAGICHTDVTRVISKRRGKPSRL